MLKGINSMREIAPRRERKSFLSAAADKKIGSGRRKIGAQVILVEIASFLAMIEKKPFQKNNSKGFILKKL